MIIDHEFIYKLMSLVGTIANERDDALADNKRLRVKLLDRTDDTRRLKEVIRVLQREWEIDSDAMLIDSPENIFEYSNIPAARIASAPCLYRFFCVS